ncbi:hypothetical protein [Streptomyces sp. NPDC002599]|uniref:hypothetical protein n=1 Tax=Streptomyces sp. NPDC002599 TaxID=3154421 RepID=UPI00331F2C60
MSDEFRHPQPAVKALSFVKALSAVKALFFVLGFRYATWVSGHLPSRGRVRPARTGRPQHS